MPDFLPLFDTLPRFDRTALARRLASLADQHIYLGASSWKYPGWINQVYTAERYFIRGRFSSQRFATHCLAEYAETFPIVCGDFSFYQFPSPSFWEKLFASAPPTLLFAFKAPEQITAKVIPRLPRYGARAGGLNPSFLDAEAFVTGFLDLLRPWRLQVAVIILEFGAFPPRAYRHPELFLPELDGFLAQLPQNLRYAVEIRNPELLASPYFSVLRKHGVAHVFNSWTRMPPIREQIAIDEAFTAEFLVARALLRPGRTYEEAVRLFSPYATIQEENPAVRDALRELILRAHRRRERAYLFVNNRLEGNAPMTIQAVVDSLPGDGPILES